MVFDTRSRESSRVPHPPSKPRTGCTTNADAFGVGCFDDVPFDKLTAVEERRDEL